MRGPPMSPQESLKGLRRPAGRNADVGRLDSIDPRLNAVVAARDEMITPQTNSTGMTLDLLLPCPVSIEVPIDVSGMPTTSSDPD